MHPEDDAVEPGRTRVGGDVRSRQWNRLAAEAFLVWLGAPAWRSWLDIGCGGGELTAAILRREAPAYVVGVDSSQESIVEARRRVGDARAVFAAGDACALPFRAGAFDIAVSGLALNLISDPARAVSEMRRTVRIGGVVAAYVWDYGERIRAIRDLWTAAGMPELSEGALDQTRRNRYRHPEELALLLESGGLWDVSVTTMRIPTVFRGVDEFWPPIGARLASSARADPRAKPDRVRELVCAHLPQRPDGSIQLDARAWAVRGRVPPSSEGRLRVVARNGRHARTAHSPRLGLASGLA